MKKNTGMIVIFLVFVVLAAWYFNQNFIDSPKSDIAPAPNNPKSTSETWQLTALTQTPDVSQIIKFGPGGKNEILYTDKDESNKIKKVSNTTNTPTQILAVEGSNQLVSILLDGSAKKKILNSSFLLPVSFALSPDGKKIAYTTFSNAEREYGYSVYLADENGKNGKLLIRNNQLLNNLFWLDNNNIVASQIEGDSSVIVKTNTDLGESVKLYTTSQNILSVNTVNTGFVICQSQADSNKSSVIVLDKNGKIVKTIYNEIGGLLYNVFASVDYSQISYLEAQQADADKIAYISSSNKDKQKIANAVKIISWVP